MVTLGYKVRVTSDISMTSSPGDLSNGFSLNKQITIIIMNKQYYIGLDVHKETIAIAYTHAPLSYQTYIL